MKEMKKIGFTLLEMLIAVTIFSIVAAALYSSFYAGTRILRRSQEAMELHQRLRLAAEEISLDLRNSLLAPLHEELEAISAAGVKENAVYYFLGGSESFTFVTLKEKQICNITYYLENKKLMRIIKSQSRGFTLTEGAEEILLSNIEKMEIQYSYEGPDEDSPPIWMNIWEQEERVPLGVKIKLRLKGMGVITKTVFIPVGSLGAQEEARI